MKVKHIIWDWNGTLLDDLDVSMAALNEVLKSEQLPLVLDKEEYRQYFQFPVIKYYEKVGFDFAKTPFDVLAKRYMDYYQPHSFACPLHEGAIELLKDCREKGIHQSLLSAAKLDFLFRQIDHYGIRSYFEHICGLDNIHAHSKAELAKAFVSKNHFDRSCTVFIGDSVHDYEVASYAGCRCILIANGHEHISKLEACATPVLKDINELKKLLSAV